MRWQTKFLIKSKIQVGETVVGKAACYIHVRDIRAILDCETNLLKYQINKLKKQLDHEKGKSRKPEEPV